MFIQRTVASLLLCLACISTVHGEIVIPPVARDKAVSSADNDKKIGKNRGGEAAVLRNKARAYKSGNLQSMPSSSVPVIIQMDAAPEVEEGVLLPRSDEISAAPRIKKHESSRDNIPATQDAQPGGNDEASADGQEAQIQLEKNRFKANQYMKGKPAPSLASPSNDSQMVACESIGNVSGRIGDDSMSGREVVVVRDGKQIKMRCK
ncbi:MAG: hypothetical protein A3H42_03330 [Deltaproteobacteria bacterium RIFCSPLOWO2_02_FULL_46_8]|nr:MAG: hypothetical protein A3H42_03330 [Deltaproteobacteria bacterium RIFCSPLOWO2_02_FULL_46_8]